MFLDGIRSWREERRKAMSLPDDEKAEWIMNHGPLVLQLWAINPFSAAYTCFALGAGIALALAGFYGASAIWILLGIMFWVDDMHDLSRITLLGIIASKDKTMISLHFQTSKYQDAAAKDMGRIREVISKIREAEIPYDHVAYDELDNYMAKIEQAHLGESEGHAKLADFLLRPDDYISNSPRSVYHSERSEE